MLSDAPKGRLALTAAELANATKITLSVVSLTATVSVYLVTMATFVQNSALKECMATSVSQTVRVMKMEHTYVIIEQVGFIFFTSQMISCADPEGD